MLRWWIVFIFLTWFGAAQARPAVLLHLQGGAVELEGHIEWLREPAAQWTPQEAAAAAGWQTLRGSPNAGFTKDALWLRLRVEQSVDGAPWRLQVDNTLIEQVHLYQRGADGIWQAQHAGRSVPRSDWPLDSRSPVFSLDLPTGTYELMLRLATRNSLSTSIHLWEAEHFYAHAQGEALLWGIYFGIYGLVILIQFLFWKWTKEALSGWYVLCASVNCFSMLMTMGYLQNALNMPASLATPLLSLSICVSIYIGTKFTASVLDLHRDMPRVNAFLLRGAVIAGLVSSSLVIGGAIGIGTVIAQAVSIAWILLLAWVAVILLRRRGEMAERFLLVAFGIFFVGILLRYLRNLGWLSAGPLTDNSVQIGSVLHMLVMCVYIVFRYDTLRVALQVEQAARRELHDFVMLVAHEFRTPLAIIDTSARQLATHLDAPIEKSLKRCANIQDAAQRMADLMDNYLTLERMGYAEHALHAQTCDMYALLADVTAEWPEGRIRLQMEQLPVQFICDPDMLRVALRNLISNADRHATPGTLCDVHARGEPGGHLHLSVNNKGETIPADELPLLFRKYHRGRSVRGKRGAGLGLFLVERIVQAHGGRITVHSQSGTTSFQIWLPDNQAMPPSPALKA